MRRGIIYTLCLFVFCFFVGARVWAQDIQTAVSPSFYHLIAKPGHANVFTLNVANTGDPQFYTFNVYQLGKPDLYGNLYPLSDAEVNSPIEIEIIAPYIRIGEQFLMRTGDIQEIPVEVFIPQETTPGEYYFALSAETIAPVPNQGSTTIQLSGGNATLIIITVSENNNDTKKIETSLFKAITGFSMPFGGSTLQFVDTNTPIPLSFIVKNSGKYSVIPQGEVTIKGRSGDKQRFGIVPVYLYAGSQRLLTTADFSKETCLERFSESLCSKDYSVIFDALPIGFYEVVATVSYGNPSPIIYSRDYFIVVPVGIILVIIGMVVVALGMLGYAWHRHLKASHTGSYPHSPHTHRSHSRPHSHTHTKHK